VTAVAERQATVGSLRADHITVRFGGHIALEDVTIEAPVAGITALIGPNGAGKSTFFNACSGLVKPDRGSVQLFGRELSNLAPSARAQRGLGRTFQQMQLYDTLPVGTNVQLGMEARVAGANLLRTLWQPRAIRREIHGVRDEALALCGLEGLRDYPAGALSTGQRRMVELARAVAGRYSVLLLDEPSSGLDHSESEEFGRVLQRIVEREGTGILLVEHDIALVRAVCDYAYVLDFGRLIAQGPTEEVMSSDLIRAAYLGAEVR